MLERSSRQRCWFATLRFFRIEMKIHDPSRFVPVLDHIWQLRLSGRTRSTRYFSHLERTAKKKALLLRNALQTPESLYLYKKNCEKTQSEAVHVCLRFKFYDKKEDQLFLSHFSKIGNVTGQKVSHTIWNCKSNFEVTSREAKFSTVFNVTFHERIDLLKRNPLCRLNENQFYTTLFVYHCKKFTNLYTIPKFRSERYHFKNCLTTKFILVRTINRTYAHQESPLLFQP